MHVRDYVCTVNDKFLCSWCSEGNVHDSAILSAVDMLSSSHGGALHLQSCRTREIEKVLLIFAMSGMKSER